MIKRSRYLNLVKFNFDINNKYISGVYMINDFYVGESSDIYGRILSHIRTAISGGGHNKELGNRIKSMIDNDEIIVINMLSNNRWDERHFFNVYTNKGYSLLNIGTTNYKYSSHGI